MSTSPNPPFSGLTVALATPMRAGSIDYEALADLVDWHVEQGTPRLAPVGTTGESPTLDHEEHRRVIAAVVERAAGRLEVLAGTGSNATAEAVSLTKFAAEVGADGTLQVAPYYNKPTQEGLYAHFLQIAENAPIPMMLYNIPGRTGRNLEVATAARLAKHPHIVAIKEASGSLTQVDALLAETDLTVVSGDDGLTLPVLALGGHGVVSVAGNVASKPIQAMIHAFQNGHIAEAQRLHRRLAPLFGALLSIGTNPEAIKTALRLLGRGDGSLRLPLVPLQESGVEQIRNALIHAELLSS